MESPYSLSATWNEAPSQAVALHFRASGGYAKSCNAQHSRDSDLKARTVVARRRKLQLDGRPRPRHLSESAVGLLPTSLVEVECERIAADA